MAVMTQTTDSHLDSAVLPLANLRDLGGIPVSGGVLRARALWRSDDPTISPQEEIQSLAGQGLAAVIDLRSSHEVRASPHAQAPRLGIAHHHLPLAEAAVHPLAMIEAAGAIQSPRDVGHWYAGLVRNHLPEVVQGLQLISSTGGGVLFHCAAGKDRTGILAGVILTLLGADQDVIVEDYAHTQENLIGIFTRLQAASYTRSKQGDVDDDARRAAEFFASDHPLLSATADSMEAMLTELGGAGGLMDLIARYQAPDPLVETLHAKLVASTGQ